MVMKNIFLKSIKLEQDYNNIKEGEKFTFKSGVTIIVGEQGSGKTSLLTILSSNFIKFSSETVSGSFNFYYFNSEKHNPRLKHRIDHLDELAPLFYSHGEVKKMILIDTLPDFKDSLILLDESESGLTIKNQYKLAKLFKKLSRQNNLQFIVATHSLPIIESFDEVFDIDKRKYVNSKDYIKEQKL